MARRPIKKTDSRRFYDWLDMAGEDMMAARILMEHPKCYRSSAFHCQQAIEKALKAYILLCTDRLVDGHNLTWLCRQCIREDKEFQQWLDECTVLNRCYIETRYPADIPLELEYEDIRKAHEMAINLFRFICAQVDEELLENPPYAE